MTVVDLDEKIYWSDAIENHLSQWIQQRNYSDVFVLMDENSYRHCSQFFKQFINEDHTFVIPSGEQSKSLATCNFIWEKLLHAKADNHALLVNIGGGMITDLGGFCASVYKRGIDYVNIPTTLLAFIDASVGGKTAIDFEGVKNAIGSFSKPEATILFPGFLNSLPERQLKSGFAEMLKHALLTGGEIYERLFHPEFFFSLINGKDIVSSIRFKSSIVKADFMEKGLRRQLNLGHSLGHAFESFFIEKNKPMLHGEAVAAGLLAEAYISTLHEALDPVYLDILVPALKHLFNWQPIRSDEVPKVLSYLSQDKKNSHSSLQFVLIRKPGEWFVSSMVKPVEIEKAIEWMNKLN
jgi:3-dehydroquinate synthase